MSGSKRTLIDRHRKSLIDSETLALFIKLESTPRRDYYELRDDDELTRQDKELARRLGLLGEWFCSICSVLDRREEHCNPGSLQEIDFKRVRAVRLDLLAAASARGLLTGEEPPATASNRRPTSSRRESRPRPN
jgi:hypothetical protein